jgi:hydrogenase maturation protease
VIVFGYGNPWRQDDGVGPALAERIVGWLVDRGADAEAEIDQQLLPEAVESLRDRDLALFCDADLREAPEGFRFEEVVPGGRFEGLNLHTVGPSWFLSLAESIGLAVPEARLLSVQGVSFDLADTLTEECVRRANRAFAAFVRFWEARGCRFGAGNGTDPVEDDVPDGPRG